MVFSARYLQIIEDFLVSFSFTPFHNIIVKVIRPKTIRPHHLIINKDVL